MSRINLDPQITSSQPLSSVNSVNSVSKTRSTTTAPQIIKESAVIYDEQVTVETNGKPSLWQQLKTKAQNLSNSAAAFVKRHPDAVKAALATTAVATFAAVFFAASQSSSLSKLPSLPPAPPSDPSAPGYCAQSDDEFSWLQPKPKVYVAIDPKKQALLLAETNPAKEPAPGSEKALFLEANENAIHPKLGPQIDLGLKQQVAIADSATLPTWKKVYSTAVEKGGELKQWVLDTRKEGITFPKSKEDVLKFVMNHPLHVVAAATGLYILSKGVSFLLKPKTTPQSFRSGSLGGVNNNGSANSSPVTSAPSTSQSFRPGSLVGVNNNGSANSSPVTSPPSTPHSTSLIKSLHSDLGHLDLTGLGDDMSNNGSANSSPISRISSGSSLSSTNLGSDYPAIGTPQHVSPQASPNVSPNVSPYVSPQASPRVAPNTSSSNSGLVNSQVHQSLLNEEGGLVMSLSLPPNDNGQVAVANFQKPFITIRPNGQVITPNNTPPSSPKGLSVNPNLPSSTIAPETKVVFSESTIETPIAGVDFNLHAKTAEFVINATPHGSVETQFKGKPEKVATLRPNENKAAPATPPKKGKGRGRRGRA